MLLVRNQNKVEIVFPNTLILKQPVHYNFDLCGPLPSESLTKKRYTLMFTDNFTRYIWIYFLRTKDEALHQFQDFKVMVENSYNQKIATLRTNRGGEYLSKTYHDFCVKSGIHHALTCAYTPHQNGESERRNRTVLEMARSLLLHVQLPKALWEEAARTAVYILNRRLTKAVQMSTPFWRLTGLIPNVKHFRVFGCAASVLLTTRFDKLSARSLPVTFIGYDTQSKAYCVYDVVNKKIYISRNIKFNESIFELAAQYDPELVDDLDILLP